MDWHDTAVQEGIAEVAFKVAKIFYPKNRDSAVAFEDFVHEILLEISRKCGATPADPPLMWKIARDKAIDLLRTGNRRSHRSLNTPVDDGEGGTVEWGEIRYGQETGQLIRKIEEILTFVALEESTPKSFQELIYQRLAGYPLTPTERKRLSRLKRQIDVTIWEELFGIH